MAEIILPPEEEQEETPQVPELNVDKPTTNSKVITIEFEAKKTNKVSTKDTNQQLYTTDTDAWFEFKETSLEGANGTYSVVFRNRHDGSIFQRTGDVVNGVAYYKIPHQEIRHAGAWRGQIVYTLSNGDTTAREFDYDVKGHILDGKDVREIVVEDFETLMAQLRSMKDNAEVELADLVNTAEQNETDRQAFFDDLVEDIDELQANYQELLDTGVLQTNINEKLEELEEEYAPKLNEVTAQLAQTKSELSFDLGKKVTKGEPDVISWAMADQNFREIALGEKPMPVVGIDSVGKDNVISNSLNLPHISDDVWLNVFGERSNIPVKMEIGSLTTQTGEPIDQNSRIRTTDYIRMHEGEVISMVHEAGGVSFRVFQYDIETLELVGYSGYVESFTLSQNYWVKLLIRYNDDREIEPSEVQTLTNLISAPSELSRLSSKNHSIEGNLLPSLSLEMGSVNIDGNLGGSYDMPADNRARSWYIKTSDIVDVNCNGNVEVRILYFEENDGSLQSTLTGYVRNRTISTLYPYARFIFRKTDGSNIESLSEITDNVVVKLQKDYVIKQSIEKINATGNALEDLEQTFNSVPNFSTAIKSLKDIYKSPEQGVLTLPEASLDYWVSLWDSLLLDFPEYVSKKLHGYSNGADDDDGLPVYEYTFKYSPTAEISSMYGDFSYIEDNLKLKKIIATGGIHGNEQWAMWSTYSFFKDLCFNSNNDPLLNYIKSNVEFKIIPMSNPEGVNANTRSEVNHSGDPNRNFPQVGRNIHTIIDEFVGNNSDAICYLDIHNNWYNTTTKDDMSLHIVTSATSDDNMLKNIYAGTINSLSHEWINKYVQVKEASDTFISENNKPYPFAFVTPNVNTSLADGVQKKYGVKSYLLELQADNVFSDDYERNNTTIVEMGADVLGNLILNLLENESNI